MANVPLLLGHRGTRVDSGVPENTPEAFDTAIRSGCDGFEFDVRLTGCGRGLVCHDEVVEGVMVRQAKPHELRNYPVVGDIISRYGDRVFLDIELKVEGLERMVLELLRESPPQREYVVSSFLPEVIMELRARSAKVPLGIICDTKSQLARWQTLPIEHVIVHEKLCTEKLIKEAHAAHKGIFVWTVNHPDNMRRFADAGVDVIISDDPRLLVQTLRPEKSSDGPPSGANGKGQGAGSL